jgi:hypothetical protein
MGTIIEIIDRNFQPITNVLIKTFGDKLLIQYKQNADYIKYVQFYFENWKNTFWYEVRMYPNDGIYLYKYDGEDYSEITKFGCLETEKLIKYIIPLLHELSEL